MLLLFSEKSISWSGWSRTNGPSTVWRSECYLLLQ
jgi:hypothetical protein